MGSLVHAMRHAHAAYLFGLLEMELDLARPQARDAVRLRLEARYERWRKSNWTGRS